MQRAFGNYYDNNPFVDHHYHRAIVNCRYHGASIGCHYHRAIVNSQDSRAIVYYHYRRGSIGWRIDEGCHECHQPTCKLNDAATLEMQTGVPCTCASANKYYTRENGSCRDVMEM